MIYRHALRNAMIPLVTVFGITLGLIITSTFFIEQIFNIPGIAQVSISSINDRDYPVIQATTVLLAVMVKAGIRTVLPWHYATRFNNGSRSTRDVKRRDGCCYTRGSYNATGPARAEEIGDSLARFAAAAAA